MASGWPIPPQDDHQHLPKKAGQKKPAILQEKLAIKKAPFQEIPDYNNIFYARGHNFLWKQDP